MFFFFNDTATTEIYTLSLHDALPILNFLYKNGNITDITNPFCKRIIDCKTATVYQTITDIKTCTWHLLHFTHFHSVVERRVFLKDALPPPYILSA